MVAKVTTPVKPPLAVPKEILKVASIESAIQSDEPLSLRQRLLLQDKGLNPILEQILGNSQSAPEAPASAQKVEDDDEMVHRPRRRQIEDSD